MNAVAYLQTGLLAEELIWSSFNIKNIKNVWAVINIMLVVCFWLVLLRALRQAQCPGIFMPAFAGKNRAIRLLLRLLKFPL